MTNQAGEMIREKRKRKGWSQTILGDFVGMSAATIHRIEHGEKFPTDSEVNLIAGMLGLDCNQLQTAFEQDHQNRKQRLPESAYRTEWDYAHPAIYAGKVWIQIYPQPAHKTEQVTYTLRWGPWQKTGTLNFNGAERLSLIYYKHNDQQGLPQFLSLSAPCYVVFGKDEPPDQNPIPIYFGWQRVEPYPPRLIMRFAWDFVRQSLRLIFSRSK